MLSTINKLRHRWLWYAAAGEGLVLVIVVLLMVRSFHSSHEESRPQAIEHRHQNPVEMHRLSHVGLGHLGADK